MTDKFMPAEVISTVHQLAVACKKYKGIKFTDKASYIINDDNDPEEIKIPDNDNDENVNTTYPEEDKISVENESPEDAHITTNDINTIEHMNTAQLNMDPEAGGHVTEDRHERSNMASNNMTTYGPGLQRGMSSTLSCKIANNQLI